jgi:hypothetical protein
VERETDAQSREIHAQTGSPGRKECEKRPKFDLAPIVLLQNLPGFEVCCVMCSLRLIGFGASASFFGVKVPIPASASASAHRRNETAHRLEAGIVELKTEILPIVALSQ